MGFVACLKFGKIFEKEALRFLEYDEVVQGKLTQKEFDFFTVSDGVRTFYEIKADRYLLATGNICIEYEHNKKKSGIAVTYSDFYVYFGVNPDNYQDYRCFIIPTHVIRDEIDKQSYHKNFKNWGTRCYLFRIALFEQYEVWVI